MATRGSVARLRHLLVGTLAAFACLCVTSTHAADEAPEHRPMNLAPEITQAQTTQDATSSSPLISSEDDAAPLRLEHMLSSLEQLVVPGNHPGALARSPSWTSLLKFFYWFSLLLLASLSARDALRLFHHLLSRPPTPAPSMPYAPWPSVTVVFETRSVQNLTHSLAALSAVDYPAERLRVIALCTLDDADIKAAVQTHMAGALAGRFDAFPCSYSGDLAGRCFSVGLRRGHSELLMVLSDSSPCLRDAIKACAERFFDPSLGALLGFLPGAAANDRALAPRIANLLRVASRTAGITFNAGMTPGTGLLALRRSAVRTAGLNPAEAADCFALLRQLERFGNHHALQEGVIAAGQVVHNWGARSRWIASYASAFAAAVPLNPLRWLAGNQVIPTQWGMRARFILPSLWLIVATGAFILYFAGHPIAAMAGLAVCATCAYGVDGMPSAFNSTAVLFRVHGRRAEASLVAWAPVVFCHDLLVTVCSTLRGLRLRVSSRPAQQAAATQPLEQSTLG